MLYLKSKNVEYFGIDTDQLVTVSASAGRGPRCEFFYTKRALVVTQVTVGRHILRIDPERLPYKTLYFEHTYHTETPKVTSLWTYA